VVVFALVGGAASYVYVNGAPGFLQSTEPEGSETPGAVAGTGS